MRDGMPRGHRGGFHRGHHASFEQGHVRRDGFHHRGFGDDDLVPFRFSYGYGDVSSPYDTYCNPGSRYYDPNACWDYYNG